MQVHESHKNTIQERATGDIALRRTGNAQGAYFFMIFTTGQRMNRQYFTPLPLPQYIINIVHRLAHRNIRGLNIWDIYRHPILEAEDGSNDDTNKFAYAMSNKENRETSDESNENDDYNDTNINPPTDWEMEHRSTGVTRPTTGGHFRDIGVHQSEEKAGFRENAGVYKNKENAGVQEKTNAPQNDHIDPWNFLTIKMQNTIDATEEKDEN